MEDFAKACHNDLRGKFSPTHSYCEYIERGKIRIFVAPVMYTNHDEQLALPLSGVVTMGDSRKPNQQFIPSASLCH